MKVKLTLIVVTLALSGLCGAAQTSEQEQRLTILHTNDHHGRFWKDKRDQIGMAARKTLIDSIRAEVASKGGQVLLLSGGDINTGVPESDMQYAKPDFIGMKHLSYDAMAVGNHEFDVPNGVMRMQQIWSQVPFLSANIYDKQTGERSFAPYKVFDLEGLSVAVLGLTTTDTLKVGSSKLKQHYTITDPTDEVLKLKKELNGDNPDVVIALTHMGHYADGEHGSNAYGDVSLAKKLPKGTLDAIIGGHSQNIVCYTLDLRKRNGFEPGDACSPDKHNGTWVMQAQEWGRFVGRADFTITGDEVELTNYQLIPINLKKKVKIDGNKEYVLYQEEIAQNTETTSLLKPYYEKGNNLISYKVSNITQRLEGDRKIVRFQQTNLGHAISDSIMLKTSADLAIMNSGGIRDSIEEGEVTYRDILKVLPWGNSVVTVELAGDELKTYLLAVLQKTPGSGGYVQRSSNFAAIDGEIFLNGNKLVPTQTYKLALPSYVSRGGDGYPKLNKHSSYIDTGYVDADVLKEFLAKSQ
ncbi:bifunctional UDP-sugar hydrolase/5'-nucleotidase UshA [Vibrio splendidus]|uniref:bifunctional UDP-sugar hydrolase/5'-nucleotidase UshA n=1 Tax=Vibrio splendidus TaxID=29497 RepID=UPI0006CA11C9|nr:bifunctional UDP-sugar hydrolase/5'-nucleotidase UshA [Vibrio splendidus]KPM01467.1 hypothetical protein AN167_02840 [Vibrio splendidus]